MLKTSSVTLLFIALAACGTGVPTATTPAQQTPESPEAPVTVVSQEPAPVEVAPAPVQDANIVAQQPNAPVADPNAVDPNDSNPDHLQTDPVTGKYDFRYGVWSAGTIGTSPSTTCGSIHGATIKFEQIGGIWYVAGTKDVVTFGPDKSASWVWDYSGDAETWSADGKGTYVFAEQNVSCELTIQP